MFPRVAEHRLRNKVAWGAAAVHSASQTLARLQSADSQVRLLCANGCAKVFREAARRAKADCAQLAKALGIPDTDNGLMVTRLDRLARSMHDLPNTLGTIADRKAGFKSLGDT